MQGCEQAELGLAFKVALLANGPVIFALLKLNLNPQSLNEHIHLIDLTGLVFYFEGKITNNRISITNRCFIKRKRKNTDAL